jgi:hypothetical protein
MDLPNQPIANLPETEMHETAQESKPSYVVADMVQPICTVDFSNSPIQSKNARVQTGPGAYYNSYYGNSWIMHYPGSSYFRIETNIDHVDQSKHYLIDMVHLSSIVNGTLMDAPITILVNGQTAVVGHNPNNENYLREIFDITSCVVEGDNLIEIRFDEGAQTNYWIQSLSVVQQ